MNLRPSEIYFTQSSISSIFGRRTRHRSKGIGDTLDDLAEGRISIGSIPKMSVMKEDGKWWTADNRRLWIFRHLEKLQKCTEIPVNITYSIDSRKRSSTNGGTDVSIYRGYSPGGIWHRKVESIKIPDKPKSKNVLTVPVVQHHAINQYGGTFSDNKILECNDRPIKPTEPNKWSPYSMIESDWISSVLISETAKIKLYLRKAAKSDEIRTKMNYNPTENSTLSCVRQNIPSASHKTDYVKACPVNSQTTLDHISKSSSPHQSLRYKPYNCVREYSKSEILKPTMACKTTSSNRKGNTCNDSYGFNFSKKVRFAKANAIFAPNSIHQRDKKYYSFFPKKKVYSCQKAKDDKYHDTDTDDEDEYEYCYDNESDISDDSQSPDNIKSYALNESSDNSDEKSSDDSDEESSDESESNGDDSNESDDEHSDHSNIDRLNYSPKKNLSNTTMEVSSHLTREFQYTVRKSSDISYDSSNNSVVDEFRCYAVTYRNHEGHLFIDYDEENSCDFYDEENNPFKYWNMEASAISNIDSDDHYTAVLDRAFLSGYYNSDVDNMIYDYID